MTQIEILQIQDIASKTGVTLVTFDTHSKSDPRLLVEEKSNKPARL